MQLKTVLGDYPHVRALRDGAVATAGFSLEYLEFSDLAQAFPRMLAQTPEFDVCEVALGPYLLGRSLMKPVTVIPVILTRDFQHALIVVNDNSGIDEPKALEGKRVGCRFYCQTSAIWTRGILATQYRVELDRITWVVAEAEPVEGAGSYPSNVVGGAGQRLADMLRSGEVDAAVGMRPLAGSNLVPLIPDAHVAEAEWYQRTGVYPVNHAVTVSDALLTEHPWIGNALFEAFQDAKEVYLSQLKSTGGATPEDAERLRLATIVGGDPLPYGLDQNRRTLELLLEWAHQQGVTPRAFSVEDLFTDPGLPLTPGSAIGLP